MRQEVERKIATAVVETLLAAGFYIEVDNGEDMNKPSRTAAVILRQMFLTDDEGLLVSKGAESKAFGWVYFVYGNDGWDVVSDYTVNLEEYVGEKSLAGKISDHYTS
jgi:hypothetical protein